MREAQTLSAVPGLVIAAVARDMAFGHEGHWTGAMGRIFRTVKIRTRATSGEYAVIDTHDLGQLVSCEELLVQRIYDFSLLPFVPDLVVDCGGHIGLFSLLAASTYQHAAVTVYEPEPENLKVLRRQLERFGLRIKIVEAAVSDKEGLSGFRVFESNSGHLNAADDPKALATERQLTVKTIDLTEHAQSWQGKKLLVKMDIEGAEAQVIPRLLDRFPRDTAMFLEMHGDESVRERLSSLLAQAGFALNLTRSSEASSDWFALRVA